MAFLGNFARQVDGEAEGVVQLEHFLAGNDVGMLLDGSADEVGEDVQTRVDGRVEAFLLHGKYLADIVAALAQLGVCALALGNGNVDNIYKERVIDAEQLSVTAGAADDAAEDVSAPFVGGNHAVGDHEHGASHVVGDDTDGDVVVLVLTVGLAGNFADLVQHAADGIDLKHIVHVLHDARKTLESHARVDVLLLELGVGAVAHVVELGEHVVPDLHEAVAVASRTATGLAAAVLLAAVKVDLGAGSAGTGAVFPEVVFLAELGDALRGDADDVVPEVERLLIVHVDGGPQLFGRNVQPFGGGQEFPRPRNRLFFEVVAEGEVAEHLKEGAVAGGVSHAFEVGGTDALLAGRDAVAGRLDLAREELLHRRHTGVDEQKRFVVHRYQGERREAEMSFGFKERKVLLAQLVEGCPFHIGIPF